MEITCNFCGETKDREYFTKNKSIKRGYNLCCKLCSNEKQKVYRVSNGNVETLKYEKTKKGYLVRTYRNMLSRVTGIQKKNLYLYEGLEILNKESFYEWALQDLEYHRLFDEFTASGYIRKLSPSIDRIDTDKGYVLGNIRWLTHSENSRLGATSDKRYYKTK